MSLPSRRSKITRNLTLEDPLCSLDQFKKEYDKKIVTEWLAAYIDYEALELYLYFLKRCYDYYHHLLFKNHQNYVKLLPVEPRVRIQIQQAMDSINILVEEGVEKARRFVDWKIKELLFYWQQVIELTQENEDLSIITQIAYDKRKYLKQFLKIIYANAICLKDFIELNDGIMSHCDQVMKQYGKSLIVSDCAKPDHSDGSAFNQSHSTPISRSMPQIHKKNSFLKVQNIQSAMSYLNIVIDKTVDLFYSPIYYSEDSEESISDYANTNPSKEISGKNGVLLGMYIGIGVVILAVTIAFLILESLQVNSADQKIDLIIYIFPMFRGVGLLILYLWGMAWNVYGFIKYKINFKLILRYGPHYSSPMQIMKRAGFFTLLFCLMLFIYLVGLDIQKSLSIDLPIQYTPFVVWVFYFAYIFFPSQEMFNKKGRKYFYSLLKNIVLSPFTKMTFVISFATDQGVSFVTSIKDLAYTVCYYGSDFSNREASKCLDYRQLNGIIVGYVAALTPLALRMIQCYRTAKSEGDFLCHLQMWNFFKYFSTVLTATLSFLSAPFPSLFVPFIVSSVVSTLYSYYWDLKNDWGLLEKGSRHFLLRNNLCYKSPSIYYAAIVVNLLFRCSWTLTISPAVFLLIPKSTFLPFLTGFVEILRRCMWNFFRIEKEHVGNCNQFVIAKESLEKLLAKIRAQKPMRAISKIMVEGSPETVVGYVKEDQSSFLHHLESIVGQQQISMDEIEEAKRNFETYQQLSQQKQFLNNSCQRVKLTLKIKTKFSNV